MKKTAPTSHPISGLFSLLLFGLFVLFLLIMLLFSAQIYQQSIKRQIPKQILAPFPPISPQNSGSTMFRMEFLRMN
ncbi:hypothetical protein [Blautia obeum]|uniref:hypothetical protein n=1 Tax=Blautia obeum TaxID=40520 RepID=UPI001FB140DB|nr:hypothetical protein [Blautia obeum]